MTSMKNLSVDVLRIARACCWWGRSWGAPLRAANSVAAATRAARVFAMQPSKEKTIP
jgi:hypothetical protein